MGNFIDITGNTYGRLTVSERAENDKRGEVVWVCQCSCGNTINAKGWRLKSGHTSSCGCLRKEVLGALNRTHGKSLHPLYNVYKGMKTRCESKASHVYPYYLKKGIKVCGRWLNSVDNFIEDMFDDYKQGLQLDRIDPNKDYSPENCRWVTPQQNQMNTSSRRNSSSKYKGVCWIKSMGKWRAGITLSGKYNLLGYFTDEASAALAYNLAAKELFREYATLNTFITDSTETIS